MSIKEITVSELKKITTEGLIIQGRKEDPVYLVNFINKVLTEDGILKNGSKFTDVKVFKNEGIRNLLFNMDGVDLNIHSLAMWRIHFHQFFTSVWLSDYLSNRLGVELGEATE